MTDRFKFRFYHHETEKEYEVKAICFEGRPIITVQYNPVLKFPLDSGELIQCTGLKDKNGKLIYEGDIVENNGLLGFVRWNNLAQKYEVKFLGQILGGSMWAKESEVIGNIHENEELLK